MGPTCLSRHGASIHRLLTALPPKPVSDSPIPFSRENFKTQTPDLCEEQEGGLGPSGRPVLEATFGASHARRADNAFLPGRAAQAHSPSRQEGSTP